PAAASQLSLTSSTSTVAVTPVGAASELSTVTLVVPVMGPVVGHGLLRAALAFRVFTPGIELRVFHVTSYGYVVSVTLPVGRSNVTLATGVAPEYQPSRGSGSPSPSTSARTVTSPRTVEPAAGTVIAVVICGLNTLNSQGALMLSLPA